MDECKQKYYLDPLLIESHSLKREAVKRRKDYDEKTLHNADLEKYLSDGWEIDKKTTDKVKMQRL